MKRPIYNAIDPSLRGVLIRGQKGDRHEPPLVPVLIVVNDGCANVSKGDLRPGEEAALVGEMIRAKKVRSIVLGTAGQGWRMPDGSIFAPAQELAVAMGGEFHPMDEIAAVSLSRPEMTT